MSCASRRNGRRILVETIRWCERHDIHAHAVQHRIARMAITCSMTEANMLVYANANVPESLRLPHDAVGFDHLSVGAYQQQTPMWGSVESCMNIATSTDKFLNDLHSRGLASWHARPEELWLRIQEVQVSAFADGSNYRAQMARSWRFMVLNWRIARLQARGAVRVDHHGKGKK